jgi:hypothetical protein
MQPVIETLTTLCGFGAEALGKLSDILALARCGEPLPELMYIWAEVVTGVVTAEDRPVVPLDELIPLSMSRKEEKCRFG